MKIQSNTSLLIEDKNMGIRVFKAMIIENGQYKIHYTITENFFFLYKMLLCIFWIKIQGVVIKQLESMHTYLVIIYVIKKCWRYIIIRMMRIQELSYMYSLYMAVHCGIRDARKQKTTGEIIPRNKKLRNFYDKKREEGKPFIVAIIACVNKLLHWIYALLKNKTTCKDIA